MRALREDLARALDAGRPEQAWDLAAQVWSEGTPRERHDARRLLNAVGPRLPEAAWTRGREDLAGRAKIKRPATRHAVGRVAFPAVGEVGDRFLEVVVETLREGEDTLPEGLDTATRHALRNALGAARHHLRSNTSFAVHVTSSLDWGGPSCGLATGLAAVSAARSLPMSATLSATGELRPDGIVEPVGGVDRKLALRRAARPRGRMLVPEGDGHGGHPDVVHVRSLAQALEGAGLGLADVDLDAELRRVRTLDQEGQWLEAMRLAEDLWAREDLEEQDRALLLAVRLSGANHSGDPKQVAACLAKATDFLGVAGASEDLARIFAGWVVARVDAFDPLGAHRVLDLARASTWGKAAQVHLRGCEALLATLDGDHTLALSLRQDNLDEALRAEKPRCYGDLADAYLRLGDAEAALIAAERGLEASREPRRRGYQIRTQRFLHLHRARALVALGRPGEAEASLDQTKGDPGADPRLRARLLEAELRGDRALVDRVLADQEPWLRVLPLVLALADRSGAHLGDEAAASRLLAMPVFAGCTLEEAALRLPY